MTRLVDSVFGWLLPTAVMTLVEQFGLNVQRLRKAQSLTQEELSHRCDMKRSYLSDVERGVRSPAIRALERIAEALGVEPAILVGKGNH